MRATLLLLLLTLAACKDEPPAPASPPTVPEGAVPKEVPTPEAKAARKELDDRSLQIERWAVAACGDDCEDKRLAALKRMAGAKIELHTRNEKAVGFSIAGVNAYSPWSVCNVRNSDVVVDVGGTPTLAAGDVPAILRGCLDGEVITVLRAGARTALPPRKSSGKKQ